MPTTTKSRSRSKKDKDTSPVEAQEKSTQEASVATTTRNTQTMTDAPSIIEFSEDIANAEPPVPLPAGEYPAEIRGAVKKVSGAGNDYAQVQFFVAPEAYPADYTEGDPDGQVLVYNRVSLQDTPAARHRLRKFLEAIGAPGGRTVDLNDWVGRTANIAVQHDTFEGETRAVVGKVVAP